MSVEAYPGDPVAAGAATTTARNAIWNVVRVGSTSLTLVAIPIYLASQLGPRAFSAWSAAFAFASLLLVFDFGLPTAVQYAAAKEFQQDPQRRHRIAIAALALASALIIAVTLLAIPGSLLAVKFFGDVPARYAADIRVVTFFLVVGMAVTTCTNILAAFYVGIHQSIVPAIFVTPARLVSFVAVVTCGLRRTDLPTLATAFSLPLVLAFFALVGWCAVHSLEGIRPKAASLKSIIFAAGPLAIWSFANVVVTSTGALAVGHWAYNGLPAYSVASAMWAAQAGLQTAIMASFGTEYGRRLAREGRRVDLRYLDVFYTLNLSILLLGFFGAVACVLSGGLIGLQTPYGDTLTLSVTVLVLGGSTLRLAAYPLSVAIIARGRQRTLVPLVLGDALVTLTFTTMGTRFHGVEGCALAALASGALSLVAACVLIPTLSGAPTLRTRRVVLVSAAGLTIVAAFSILILTRFMSTTPFGDFVFALGCLVSTTAAGVYFYTKSARSNFETADIN